MPTITIKRKTEEPPGKMYTKLRDYCDAKLILKELGGLKPSVDWNDKQKRGEFNEKGVKGTIQVNSGSPCTITVTLEIPLLMTLFQGVIASSIQSHLDRIA